MVVLLACAVAVVCHCDLDLGIRRAGCGEDLQRLETAAVGVAVGNAVAVAVTLADTG